VARSIAEHDRARRFADLRGRAARRGPQRREGGAHRDQEGHDRFYRRSVDRFYRGRLDRRAGARTTIRRLGRVVQLVADPTARRPAVVAIKKATIVSIVGLLIASIVARSIAEHDRARRSADLRASRSSARTATARARAKAAVVAIERVKAPDGSHARSSAFSLRPS
jgi:hypothetical protein